MIITIDPRTETERQLWLETLQLAVILSVPWTLIGAQMVLLHAYEAGLPIGRTTRDVDVLVDARVMATGTAAAAANLTDHGFAATLSIDGVAHRFTRGAMIVDLLAPDGLGTRASLATVAGARTIAVPGGSQALRRSETVTVDVGGRHGTLLRPNLLGAILLKARAIEAAQDRQKHTNDLAFLLQAVADPRVMSTELSRAERRWLARHSDLVDPEHPAWRGLTRAADAQLALAILLDRPGTRPVF